MVVFVERRRPVVRVPEVGLCLSQIVFSDRVIISD